MTDLDRLREDHTLLRTKATLLDSALSTAPHARLVFREKCFSLMRMLNRHMRLEAPLLDIYRAQIATGRDILRADDHSNEHAHLRAVTELLLGGVKVSLPLVIMRVSEALEQLRAQMDAQEQMVFPLVEAAAGDAPTERAASARMLRFPISGTMSVNAILQCYPETETVFKRLQINRPQEGYESVEELAWRRGMSVSEVLQQIERAATFPIC